MRIGETLPESPSKLVLRAAYYQEDVSFGELQLCAGLESGIYGRLVTCSREGERGERHEQERLGKIRETRRRTEWERQR